MSGDACSRDALAGNHGKKDKCKNCYAHHRPHIPHRGHKTVHYTFTAFGTHAHDEIEVCWHYQPDSNSLKCQGYDYITA